METYEVKNYLWFLGCICISVGIAFRDGWAMGMIVGGCLMALTAIIGGE